MYIYIYMFYRYIYIYICIYRYKYIQRVIIDFDVIIVNQLSYLNMTFDSRCVLLDVFIFVFCWHLTTIFAPILGLKMPADLLWKWSIKNWMGPYHWTPFSSVSCDSSLWSILRVFSGSVSSVGPVGNECFEPWPMGFPNMVSWCQCPVFQGSSLDVARATNVGPRKMGNPGL